MSSENLRRPVPVSNALAVLVAIGAAAGVAVVSPEGWGAVQPGDVVGYSEDRIGRPWRIVSELDFGHFIIRNGRVETIAAPDEIRPYDGLAKNITIELAGEVWRDTVLEIRRRQEREIASR